MLRQFDGKADYVMRHRFLGGGYKQPTTRFYSCVNGRVDDMYSQTRGWLGAVFEARVVQNLRRVGNSLKISLLGGKIARSH